MGTNSKSTFTYFNPITGKVEEGTIGGRGYYYDNAFRTSEDDNVIAAIHYILNNGLVDLNDESKANAFRLYLIDRGDGDVAKNELKEIVADARTFLLSKGINENYYGQGYYGDFELYDADNQEWKDLTLDTHKNKLNAYTNTNTNTNTDGVLSEAEDAKDAALNAYEQELFSLDQGTLGSDILNNYTLAEERAALSNMQLADAQYQQAAMQQAEAVKNITDQVRAERMSRLRAGMNESQIANQDMQVMLNNMNTLNQQANAMNYNRLVAQQQYDLAQDAAYQQYINAASGLGGTFAAFSASDAGDPYMQMLKRKNATGETSKQAYKGIYGG